MRKESGSRSWAAGGIAGSFGTAVGYPLDTLKVRLQTGKLVGTGGFGGAFSRVKNDGLLSVWKGVSFPIISRMFIKSALYSTYGWANSRWQHNYDTIRLEWWMYGASGALGGVVASVIQTPIDFFKIRLQTTPEHLPLTGRLRYVINTGMPANVSPYRLVYRGYTPMLFREAAGFSIYFATFETLKRELNFQGNFVKTFAAGSFCGCVGWITQFPFDVIKSRMQSSNDVDKKAREFLREAIKEHGIGVLYRGISAALLRACFVHGTSMTTYEFMLDVLNKDVN
eukprot:TRINITY_DN9248_c0_g1_i1.p1 TRINITY_DN9248_c0_g1~~TRINITY_DN9248_c0_g1_i1.p1  ORF type:complete len:283 (+),score=71.77 TRINITY_DN9248_c0_g1_i1:63-911(+)